MMRFDCFVWARSLKPSRDTSSCMQIRKANIVESMKGSSDNVARLGICELGLHAFETDMPAEILEIISKEDDSNNSHDVIPSLAQLLRHSRNLEVAYLCTPEAIQVSRIPKEGGHFCGYRNIQMLWSGLPKEAKEKLALSKPSIPDIQAMIEKAWDAGINAHGRVQTGGVKGTRKHIGTSEAEAILLNNSIPCTGKTFSGSAAWSQLLDYVEAYFASSHLSTEDEIKQISLPPIFLQRPHHSITIVGFERTKSGKRRLLTFDPAWRPPKQMTRPQPSKPHSKWDIYWTMERYRKGKRYLKRYKAFETLVIDKIEPNHHVN
ncbi:uncharacterized protein RCC_06830 [Ramularia collo-cygni]|uniref:UFSP1/2/DUB catalytic domain-containing protein n=1 Tax=Ramularia collo-cygni TaxID=112498 RepID=A0A2D3VGF6_9PEZI|nr:uncharacterized protein RCC_06830 [Ramularia collo-cygni]CZT20969.1 uncharacterized protein RCC_06830 [Ramularia collo-cygni]